MRSFKYKYLFILCLGIHALKPGTAQEFSALTTQFITVNADTFALTNVNIVDGTGGHVKTDQTITVIKGKITSIGNTAVVKVPANAKLMDCTGKTHIPGMIMMHEHLFYGESVPPQYIAQEMPVSFPRLY